MFENPHEEPRIIVDEDWKSRVEREKREAAGRPRADAQPPPAAALPPATFSLLVATLATQVMAALGQYPTRPGEPPQLHLDEARHLIDVLAMLQEKTQGNLTAEESADLDSTLHQLRMLFVAVKDQPPRTPHAAARTNG